MSYVEARRTIAPHAECILYLYLQEADGVPVPNAKVKLWAAPPPADEPPYVIEEDPNRRTDANGKFEFLVAPGATPRAIDIYAQVLGADDVPQGEPIQFHFPANEAQWVSVTLVSDNVSSRTSSDAELIPVPNLQLDPRLAAEAGVSVQFVQPTLAPYWKLISAQYQNPDESGGQAKIVGSVQDEAGQPLAGARMILTRPGEQIELATDEQGRVALTMAGDSTFDSARHEHGPYSVSVDGLPSDAVEGMGLTQGAPVQYILTWRRVVGEIVLPPLSSEVTGRIPNAPVGARVTLSREGLTLDTVLGDGGIYSFNQVPAGTYSLSLEGAGILKSGIVLDGQTPFVFDIEMPVEPEPPATPAVPAESATELLPLEMVPTEPEASAPAPELPPDAPPAEAETASPEPEPPPALELPLALPPTISPSEAEPPATLEPPSTISPIEMETPVSPEPLAASPTEAETLPPAPEPPAAPLAEAETASPPAPEPPTSISSPEVQVPVPPAEREAPPLMPETPPVPPKQQASRPPVSRPIQPPAIPQTPPEPRATQKLFPHYLLFGPSSQQSTLTCLILALDYIARYAPLVGFSVDEARYAQHVTIVGDTNSVSAAAEQELREAGCLVTRLSAPDSYALENLFKRLIASGSPYPS